MEQHRRQEEPRENIYPSEHPEHPQNFPKFLLHHLGDSWEWIPLNDTEFRPLQVFLLSQPHVNPAWSFPQSTRDHRDSRDVICHFRGAERAKNSREPEQLVPLGALQLCSSLRPVIFTPFLTTLHSDNSVFSQLCGLNTQISSFHIVSSFQRVGRARRQNAFGAPRSSL